MLQEIRGLGFEYAELSHGIRISLLPGIMEAVDAGEIKISSLHNFCPLPIGVNHAAPNIYKFTSLDRRERDNAWRHSIKTLETAARLKASVVVLHMGCIDMKEYTDKLVEMVGAGKRETPKYTALCDEAIAKREKKKAEHMDLAGEILTHLADKAEELGLRLGIENREAVEEIPFESDFDLFLREFNRPGIGYWHDTGHAQIKENLGFISHRFHLENMAARLIGFHIHDVEFPGRDHRAPGTGSVDFAALRSLVRPEHVKVFEFSPSLSPEAALGGVKFIKDTWGQG
jgi:sugar phosphate isomerase/epimerase